MIISKIERPPAAARRLGSPVNLVLTPSYLDRLADLELSHGHSKAAERLAHQATAMREALS